MVSGQRKDVKRSDITLRKELFRPTAIAIEGPPSFLSGCFRWEVELKSLLLVLLWETTWEFRVPRRSFGSLSHSYLFLSMKIVRGRR